MSARHYSIHHTVISNVQSDKAIPAQPLHEHSCERRRVVLSCVCSHLIFSLPSKLTGLIVINSILSLALFNLLYNTRKGPLASDIQPITMLMRMDYISSFTLLPRFLLGLRELYARDLQKRRGSDIYTVDDFISAPSFDALGNAVIFADSEQEGSEQSGGIQMEERETRNADGGA